MIDLHARALTQADVLELVPSLTAKTLQNWLSRGILPVEDLNPGRQAKRKFNGLGVIALRVMVRMGQFGVGPSDALDVAQRVALRADDFCASDIAALNANDVPQISIQSDRATEYLRHVLLISPEGEKTLLIAGNSLNDDNYVRFWHGEMYIPIETDFIILRSVNSLLKWNAKNPGKITKACKNEGPL